MNDKLWYSAAGIILLVVLGGAVYYAWPALVGREDGDYPGPTVNIQGRDQGGGFEPHSSP